MRKLPDNQQSGLYIEVTDWDEWHPTDLNFYLHAPRLRTRPKESIRRSVCERCRRGFFGTWDPPRSLTILRLMALTWTLRHTSRSGGRRTTFTQELKQAVLALQKLGLLGGATRGSNKCCLPLLIINYRPSRAPPQEGFPDRASEGTRYIPSPRFACLSSMDVSRELARKTYTRVWATRHQARLSAEGNEVAAASPTNRLRQVGFILRRTLPSAHPEQLLWPGSSTACTQPLQDQGLATVFLGAEDLLDREKLSRLFQPGHSYQGVVILGEVSRAFLNELREYERRIVARFTARYPGSFAIRF